jgi:hypothetical protein
MTFSCVTVSGHHVAAAHSSSAEQRIRMKMSSRVSLKSKEANLISAEVTIHKAQIFFQERPRQLSPGTGK